MGTIQSCSTFSLLWQDKESKGCQAWWMKKIIPCALSVPTSLWAHAIHQHKRQRMFWITCQQTVRVVNTSLLSGLLWHCHKVQVLRLVGAGSSESAPGAERSRVKCYTTPGGPPTLKPGGAVHSPGGWTQTLTKEVTIQSACDFIKVAAI